MNYFTRDRYLALQDRGDDAMDAADAAWDEAVARYDAYLQTIRPEMPESVRELLDVFYLHDARVLSMGRRGDTFVISVQLDVPPNELLTITYSLAGTPEIKQERFPWAAATATPPATPCVNPWPIPTATGSNRGSLPLRNTLR